MDRYIVTPPFGSTNNSSGAADRPWQKGYFNELPGWQEYLAEATGYGIVSGCTPSISGLTVSVASGIVHLADGTRKEISASTVTLDSADTTNPRIDLVYITSAGVVSKITGTASATPSAPALPANGISVAQISVVANASTGTLTDMRKIAWQAEEKVKVIYVETPYNQYGDCIIIKTPDKNMMIDSGYSNIDWYNNILNALHDNNVEHIDYFLLTHYHGDHYGCMAGIDGDNLNFLAEPEFADTLFYLPSPANRPSSLSWVSNTHTSIVNKLTSANKQYVVLSNDIELGLSVNATIKLLCANAADIQAYLADKAIDENEYSVQALLTHREKKFFFAGDAERFEIPYLLNNYILNAVDVYKLNHHGMRYQVATGADTSYILQVAEKTSPKYCISTVNGALFVDSEDFVLTIPRYALNAFVGVGSKCYQTKETLIFESDGYYVKNLSTYQVETVDRQTDTNVNIYIDGTNSSGVFDGSSENPYPNFEIATQFLPTINDACTINFVVADGTYNNLSLNHVQVPIYLYFNDNGVTINKLTVKHCNKVHFVNKVAINKIRIEQLYTLYAPELTIDSTSLGENDTAMALSGVSYFVVEKLSYKGRGNDTTKILRFGVIQNSSFVVRELNIQDEGRAALQRDLGASFFIRTLNATNVESCIVQANSTSGICNVKNIGTLTNVGKVFYDLHTSGAVLFESQYTNNHIGTSSNKPPIAEVKIGHYYFDTTLNKMIISNGTNWIDTTNGNVVS